MAAVVGGLVLRVVAPSPLWLDEALSVTIAELPFDEMVDALRHDGHPGLYYLLLGWWIDLFGDTNAAVRAFSGVCSVLIVPVLWAIGNRRAGAIGVVAALVGLSSPFLLRYGTEARMYALLALLVAVTWLATERAAERPTLLRLVVLGASVAALVHTHYWSFWVIGSAFVVIGFAAIRADSARRSTLIRVEAAIVVGAATFVVWLGVFTDQLGSTGTPWASRARPAEIAVETLQAVGGNNRFEGELLGIAMVFLAVLGAFGLRHADAVELRFRGGLPLTGAAAVAALTLTIGGAAAAITAGAFEGRYGAVVVAFVLVLAARGLWLLPDHIRLGAVAVVVALGIGIGADEARRDRTQAGEVAAAIDDGYQSGDIVVFCPDQVGPATLRALHTPVEAMAYPRGDGTLVDWRDYADVIAATSPEAFVAGVEVDAGEGDIWLVTGLGYRGLGNRCEAIIDLLGAQRDQVRLVATSTAFEPMLLTRYERRP